MAIFVMLLLSLKVKRILSTTCLNIYLPLWILLTQILSKMVKSIGFDCNNPLNIRFSPMNKWLGQVDSKKGFCVFDTLEHGFRAALVLLCNYQRKGYDTISKIISHWAPETENDTQAYIRYCCHRLGHLTPSDVWCDFDPHERIVDFDTLYDLAAAMCKMEIGVDPFPLTNLDFHWSFVHARTNYKYPLLKQ